MDFLGDALLFGWLAFMLFGMAFVIGASDLPWGFALGLGLLLGVLLVGEGSYPAVFARGEGWLTANRALALGGYLAAALAGWWRGRRRYSG